jgi:heparin/heparan-sulfate lyase
MRWRLPLVSLLLCLLPVSSALGQTRRPTVRKDHPRIFVTSETLPALRCRCQTTGKEDFQKMLSAGWIMKKKCGTDWSDVNNMPMPAFLYLVTGKPEYLAKTREFLDAFDVAMPKDQYKTPAALRAAAMCYDWCYRGLSPDERTRYAKLLVRMARYCDGLWRHSDFNNHFVLESVVVLYAGIALAHDGVEQKAAEQFLTKGTKLLREHAFPAANEIAGRDDPSAAKVRGFLTEGAGGQAEGFSYNDWGYAQPLAHLVEMWRTATGEDLYAKSDFLRSQARWHLYSLRPDTRTFVRSEDCPSAHAPGSNLKNFMHLLAARYQDGAAEFLARQVQRKYVQTAWHELLWRDDGLRATSPERWPLAFHFRKLGHVVFRSGWASSGDTLATLQCGPFYAGHQHLDNNAFVIHKRGSLAIDSGVNDYTSHRANYYGRTIAHNTIVVFDPSETFSGRVWPGGNDAGGANDGGQLRVGAIGRVGQFKAGSPQDGGRIVAYRCGERFSYAAGDASRSYSPRKLKTFVRQMVHVRPDVFIVFDRVTVARPQLKTTWLLHTINKPAIGESQFTVTEGDGQLLGQTFLPTAARSRLVGGPGNEYAVNGKNYPPSKNKRDARAGTWRIEITPGKPRTAHRFLHLMEAGATGDAAKVTVAKRVVEANRVGLEFTYQATRWQVTFATDGPPVAHIKVSAPSGRVLEEATLGASK